MSTARKPQADVSAGTVPAEELAGAFPPMHLPIQPPYPPAEARSVKEIPRERRWL